MSTWCPPQPVVNLMNSLRKGDGKMNTKGAGKGLAKGGKSSGKPKRSKHSSRSKRGAERVLWKHPLWALSPLWQGVRRLWKHGAPEEDVSLRTEGGIATRSERQCGETEGQRQGTAEPWWKADLEARTRKDDQEVEALKKWH